MIATNGLHLSHDLAFATGLSAGMLAQSDTPWWVWLLVTITGCAVTQYRFRQEEREGARTHV